MNAEIRHDTNLVIIGDTTDRHNNNLRHDDVIKWKYFPRYWPFVRGIHWWPVNSPHRGQWRGDLMFYLICAWIWCHQWCLEWLDALRWRYAKTFHTIYNNVSAFQKVLFKSQTPNIPHPLLAVYTDGFAWWRHQMGTVSVLLAICAGNSPVPGEFPAQRPVTRNFDVFFDLRLNKRLSKQSRGWWFETLSRPLWRHCNAKCKTVTFLYIGNLLELLQACTNAKGQISQRNRIWYGSPRFHFCNKVLDIELNKPLAYGPSLSHTLFPNQGTFFWNGTVRNETVCKLSLMTQNTLMAFYATL